MGVSISAIVSVVLLGYKNKCAACAGSICGVIYSVIISSIHLAISKIQVRPCSG